MITDEYCLGGTKCIVYDTTGLTWSDLVFVVGGVLLVALAVWVMRRLPVLSSKPVGPTPDSATESEKRRDLLRTSGLWGELPNSSPSVLKRRVQTRRRHRH